MDDIKEWLSYDPNTGIFTWIKPRKGIKKNKVAGRLDRNGYITICFDGNHYLAHRLAWWWVFGKWPTNLLDHKDQDKSNNKIENLRECDYSTNGANLKSKRKYKGVFYDKRDNLIFSQIRFNNKSIRIGTFKTEEEAARAYDKKALELFGEYAFLNYKELSENGKRT